MIDIPIGKALAAMPAVEHGSCEGCVLNFSSSKCWGLLCNSVSVDKNAIFKLVDLPDRDNIKSCYELSQGRENNENDKSKN